MCIYDFFRMTIFLRIFIFQITFEKFDMSKIYFQTTAYVFHVMKTEKKYFFLALECLGWDVSKMCIIKTSSKWNISFIFGIILLRFIDPTYTF